MATKSRKTKATTVEAKSAPQAGAPAIVESIKGFDTNLRCRGYKFEVGQTYSVDGNIVACENGFHAIEGYPLEVFDYYPPSGSRYCVVEQSGDLARHGSDSKIASASISIKFEISLHDLIARAVKWVFDRATPEGEGSHATGDMGAASATGVWGAASATGVRGAASATGDMGAASATGVRGAASATGDMGAASATGVHSVATGSGFDSKAMAGETGAICLVSRDPSTDAILAIRASKVGENGVKPDTWYSLNSAGEFVEVEG